MGQNSDCSNNRIKDINTNNIFYSIINLVNIVNLVNLVLILI